MNWSSFYHMRKPWRERWHKTRAWKVHYFPNGNPTPRMFGTHLYANSQHGAFIYSPNHQRKTWALDRAHDRYIRWKRYNA